MVVLFGDIASHEASSFLAKNLAGWIEIDPTKTTTSSSDANYVASSDISDKRFLCDTPLTIGSCSCAVGSKGLVTEGGRTFPGSSLNASGAQTAVIGPLGIRGPVTGVPHPAFRFASRVTDVAVNMTDITFPGKERVVWDAKFRLTGPDGSLGSDYLPSSLAPIGGEVQNFHKMCSAINSWRMYKLKILAGGDAPIDQTIVMKSTIFKIPELIDPAKAGKTDESLAGAGKDEASLKIVGKRLFSTSGAPSKDSVGAVATSSFACRSEVTGMPDESTYRASSSLAVRPEVRGFPSVTSTSFADDCCECGPNAPPKNPPGCHKPVTVTIHSLRGDALTNFF